MAKEGLPREFDLKSQNALLKMKNVVLHHALEADANGRMAQHVWITAEAVPDIARETMSAEVDFVLWAAETRLGVCSNHHLSFDADQESLDFVADNDLRIGRNEQVSRLELLMRISTFHRFAGVDLNAAHFDPVEKARKD